MQHDEKLLNNILDALKRYPHEVAAQSQKYGFLDERGYRNFCIKEEFEVLRKNKVKIEIRLTRSVFFLIPLIP